MRPRASDPDFLVLCSGVGVVERGFESQASDLHVHLTRRLPVTLLGSGRAQLPSFRRLPAIKRTWSPLPSSVATRGKRWTTAYERDVLMELTTFSVSAFAYAKWTGCRVAVCFEPGVALAFAKLKRVFRTRLPLTMYVDGLGLPPDRLRGIADLVQVMSPVRLAEMRADGFSEREAIALPYGLDASSWRPRITREQARHQLGLTPGGEVTLAVAAVNREHKRVDVIAEEFARSGIGGTLVICGNVEDQDLARTIGARFGQSVRFMKVDAKAMPGVYAAADRLVSASLVEGFGLGLVEAAAAGLDVIAHRNEHFEWLLGSAAILVDTERPGALAEALRGDPRRDPAGAAAAVARFDWSVLLPQYLALLQSMWDRASAIDGRGRRR